MSLEDLRGLHTNEKKTLYWKKMNGKWRYCVEGNDEKDMKYFGEVENGVPNGKGRLLSRNGTKYGDYAGEWRDGKMWNGVQYDKDGKILWKIINGK